MEPSRHPVPQTQLSQQFFAGASNFSVSGGQFNAIGGDYIVNSIYLDQVEHLLAQLRRAEFALRSIPQHVGYTSANGVTIIDALDERIVLPHSLVAEYEDVHEFLLKHFRGVIGENLVAEEEYCLARQHDGRWVKPQEWPQVLEADMSEGYLWTWYVVLLMKHTFRSLTVRRSAVLLLSISYVFLPLEAYIPLADLSLLLLSSRWYVFLFPEAYIMLTDPSVFLLFSLLYVVPFLTVLFITQHRHPTEEASRFEEIVEATPPPIANRFRP
ncbi:hypothetical protein DFP72DRAFT_1091646 [Ephemerocybe angulata]|uniref:Ubiquitin-like domain-containing protein n=1 Tax=Ephemerocybe angulata TaxID=980116 RepID=A0A8H6HFL8_9AGAR|nr:hypothetical protein DFP72DRAFT_1091646 [Tulosesus angulatus]